MYKKRIYTLYITIMNIPQKCESQCNTLGTDVFLSHHPALLTDEATSADEPQCNVLEAQSDFVVGQEVISLL